jgi:hypothetical protein
MIERLRSPFYYYEWLLGHLGVGILWELFATFRILTVSSCQIEKIGGAR